jgi:Na+/proline symporter
MADSSLYFNLSGLVFLAPYLFGLYWKRTTLAGVYAGIGVGLGSACLLFTIPISAECGETDVFAGQRQKKAA